MDKMTFPTAEDELTGFPKQLDRFCQLQSILALQLDMSEEELKEFRETKQQILSEHEIVERLKVEIEESKKREEHQRKNKQDARDEGDSELTLAVISGNISTEMVLQTKLKSILENKHA